MLQEDIGRDIRRNSITDISSDIDKENDTTTFQEEFTNAQASNTTIDTSFPGSSNQSSGNLANGGFGISNQNVLKNIHPSITKEKELTDSSSKGLLLKWGSRLELEALNLNQATKAIMKEVETSQKETKDMITTLVQGIDGWKQMGKSPGPTSEEKLQSMATAISALSEKVKTRGKACTCSATLKAVQNDYSALNKTIASTMKEIKSFTKHLESLERQVTMISIDNTKSQEINSKLVEAILAKLERMETQTRTDPQPFTFKDDVLPKEQSKIVKLRLSPPVGNNKNSAPVKTRDTKSISVGKPIQRKRLAPKMRSQTQVRTRSTLNMTDCDLYDIIYPNEKIKVFDFERSRKMKQALNRANKLQDQSLQMEKRIILEDDVEIGLMSE